jgi:hypothetical protein
MVSIGIAGVAAGGVLVSALVMNGAGGISLTANSSRSHHRTDWGNGGSRHWVFSTLDNSNDPTFNQLLGINNHGQIGGYFGSGMAGHPNKGYTLTVSRWGSWYRNENFPGSAQTQVIGINDFGVTVGFWANAAGANFGFYSWGGRFHSVSFPTMNNASPPVNQLLGVNDQGTAAGFYTDAKGNDHGYTFNIFSHRFHSVKIWGAKSTTAAGVNNHGDIAGFYVTPAGVTKSFLMTRGGWVKRLAWPGASMTQAFGLNDSREVVGSYTIGTGNAAKTFGFTWSPRAGWKRVNDPMGIGSTTINGVNDAGDLVGFYNDAAGNTHGFLFARGRHRAPMPPPVPSPTMSPTMTPTVSPTMSPAPKTMSPAPTSTASAPPPTAPAPVTSPSPGHW